MQVQNETKVWVRWVIIKIVFQSDLIWDEQEPSSREIYGRINLVFRCWIVFTSQ